MFFLACVVDPPADKIHLGDSATHDSSVEDTGPVACGELGDPASDCDDSNAEVGPECPELCNGIDDNCNEQIDEGVTTTFYTDADGDGAGDPAQPVEACDPGATLVSLSDDCDDADPDVHPGAVDTCDALDQDCDGVIDEDVAVTTWYEDADGDGQGDGSVALDACAEPDGYVATSGDCNDLDATVAACASCQEVLDRGIGTTDGVYTLDPCGGAPSDFWCDMTTDGGGWTVAGWQAADATSTLGLSVRNSPGDPDFSVDLACLAFDAIAVFDQTHGLVEAQSYPGSSWSETTTNLHIGDPGLAFVQGTYSPASPGIMMACVDYAYAGAVVEAYACDSDWELGPRGHMADYAGEYCGARLDYTWAWVDGLTCAYTGVPYTWGFMLRGYAGGGGND